MLWLPVHVRIVPEIGLKEEYDANLVGFVGLSESGGLMDGGTTEIAAIVMHKNGRFNQVRLEDICGDWEKILQLKG